MNKNSTKQSEDMDTLEKMREEVSMQASLCRPDISDHIERFREDLL